MGPNTAGRDGYIFEQTFNNPIGTNSKGKLYIRFMKKEILELMKDMDFGAFISKEIIEEVEKEINICFPKHYKEFMMESNGAAGSLGDNSYLIIWPIEEIIDLNEEYGVNKFTSGLVYFGSDGGGIAYAFDVRKRNVPIVEFPFDSIHIEDVIPIADTFDEFVKKLYEK